MYELRKWIKKIMVEGFEVKMKDLAIKMIHVNIIVNALRVIIEYKWQLSNEDIVDYLEGCI